MNKRDLGAFFEQKTLEFLQDKGYQLIKTNFHQKSGEIDLIMQDLDFIVFVEVKSLQYYGEFSIYETLTKSKKRRIKNTILSWLNKKNLHAENWRFDFVGVTYKSNTDYNIEHFEFVNLLQ